MLRWRPYWIVQNPTTRGTPQLVCDGFWKHYTHTYQHTKFQKLVTKCTILWIGGTLLKKDASHITPSPIGITNNTHNLWRSNHEPFICSLRRVQNDNGKLKKNRHTKSKLAQKLYEENIWLVIRTKLIIYQFFMHLTIVVVAISMKLYCFASQFLPKLQPKSVLPELIIRDSQHCWRSFIGGELSWPVIWNDSTNGRK